MVVWNRAAWAIALLAVFSIATQCLAQTPPSAPAHGKRSQAQKESEPTVSSLEAEIHEMHSQLQNQIDDLKTELALKEAEVAALQATSRTDIANVTSQVKTFSDLARQNDAEVDGLKSSVTDLQGREAAVTAGLQQVQSAQTTMKSNFDEPFAIHYKGVLITPGGFLAAESVYRQRALGADIYTNWNATPYTDAGEAHLSEWVPSARQSRLSVRADGKLPFGNLTGYFESDFLSAGTTSNNLQSNSYTMRIRHAWVQASLGNAKFTGGEMFTLLTENKKSTDADEEWLPLTTDNNYNVGFTWVRQAAFRLQDQVTPQLTVAAALEGSQYQFSASNAPANFFFGSAGAAGGLNNPDGNYTNEVSPDIVAKIAFDPGYGHFELGGIARFFRDRYYPSTASASAQNDTRLGGGFVANARFNVIKKTDVGLHLVAGDGTGRYGVSLLPDITVRPNGTLAPLRNAQGLVSLEYHPTRRWDLYGYAGSEYVQRTTYVNSTGTLVGYAPITANNTGCFAEALPTTGTGYAPGSGTCLGATRVLIQGTAGWIYRIYSGPTGKLQYGLAYSYLTREGWAGVGGAPEATNNLVYTSVRYYIP